MLTQHGWKPNPSPRRGFTFVEFLREAVARPIVVVIPETPNAFRLFRTAVDEAIGRSLDLIVLDCGHVPLSDRMRAGDDQREMATLRSLWSNPHVRVVRDDASDLERVLAFCESAGAVLLVLGADHIAASVVDLDRIFNCDFDVLVVTGHQSETHIPAQ